MNKNEIKKESNSSNKTPIEIALQIDENGMITASKLYCFLELNSAHFSEWCRRNIKNNKFAIEDEDYIVLTVDSKNVKNQGGRLKTDFKLTSDFAKKLSMTGNTERHEQARNYFIAYKQGLKIATNKFQVNSLNDILTDAFSSINNRLSKLEESIQDKPESPTNKKPYNPWFAKMQPKYKLLEEHFGITRGALYKNILMEMENLYAIDTQQICADYLYEKNQPSCYPLEPYEFDPKYRDMIEQIVNSNLIKYKIVSKDDPIASTKHVTIFDQDIEK